ncbi:cache domain-containing protein [Methanogenium marinum]|uniref:Cache domain-containing protein n=1 Tax=Methanogenium marinum TaxID=348610 RepID=A0A9Q4PVW7_9EURY|nr:hypothetical protein [Methanogenium marinum]MDE4908455.1 cache domain-containing protein [Methanogenium marinum]
MNRHEILPISILLLIAAIACILLAAPYFFPTEQGKEENTSMSDLEYMNSNIETVLTSIGDSAENAAQALSSADLMSTPEVQPVLNDLLSGSEYALSYATIDQNGTITAVAPDTYSNSVGINIGGSEPGKTIIKKREPFLSDAFTAEEGFTGIEIAWPVYSEDGEYKGSVLVMAEPSIFVGKIVNPVEEEKGITVTIMQPDGFILYDQDAAQIGKNLFNDIPFTNYRSLQALGKDISANTAGTGEYTFYKSPTDTTDLVKKHAEWDTVSYLNKEWRIILFSGW